MAAGSQESSKITIVIPAFNEENTIASVVHAARKAVPEAEILVINDGSTDSTGIRATESGAKVLSHPLNKGNGASVKTALRYISGGIVAILDGDGQHDAVQLPAMISKMSEYDLIVGTRTFSQGEGSALRNSGNVFLRHLASFLAEQTIPDLTSGFRCFKHGIALKFLHLYPNGYSFPSTSTLSFIMAGYNVGFLPIQVRPRPAHTNSKLRPFRDGFRFLTFILRIITLANPNKIFFPAGLFLLICGILLTIRNLVLFAQFPVAPFYSWPAE